MILNGDKFAVMRFLPGATVKPSTCYTDPGGNPILEKEHLRDLGGQISSNLKFTIHIENVFLAATKMVG